MRIPSPHPLADIGSPPRWASNSSGHSPLQIADPARANCQSFRDRGQSFNDPECSELRRADVLMLPNTFLVRPVKRVLCMPLACTTELS